MNYIFRIYIKNEYIDITSIKRFDPNKVKIDKKSDKKYYLLHWICNDKRFEIYRN